MLSCSAQFSAMISYENSCEGASGFIYHRVPQQGILARPGTDNPVSRKSPGSGFPCCRRKNKDVSPVISDLCNWREKWSIPSVLILDSSINVVPHARRRLADHPSREDSSKFSVGLSSALFLAPLNLAGGDLTDEPPLGKSHT
ncbi:unnamed protein product [Linum trigynum]|uniref:Uncharacterized protein n=1 Tax=Linum trigynum TaxID=586398 RepID=A0AAV2FVF4_9ROSI